MPDSNQNIEPELGLNLQACRKQPSELLKAEAEEEILAAC